MDPERVPITLSQSEITSPARALGEGPFGPNIQADFYQNIPRSTRIESDYLGPFSGSVPSSLNSGRVKSEVNESPSSLRHPRNNINRVGTQPSIHPSVRPQESHFAEKKPKINIFRRFLNIINSRIEHNDFDWREIVSSRYYIDRVNYFSFFFLLFEQIECKTYSWRTSAIHRRHRYG